MRSKFIKVLAVISFLLVMCVTLSACDPASYYFTKGGAFRCGEHRAFKL